MENNIDKFVNKIINGDCVNVMNSIPEKSIDQVITSPPYNCNISYDTYNDGLTMEQYWEWTEKWLTEAFRVLKDDGRIAINIPYEINTQERGGRVLMVAEFWMLMKKVGFNFFGIVDLEEQSPHRSKTTAWGCYDNETKVMTNNGLKLFREVDIENDLFVTINPKTKNVEYQKAFDYIEKPFKGKLVNIKHRGVDLSITDNHNMLLVDKDELIIKPFNETEGEFVIPRQHNGIISNKDIEKIIIPKVSYGLRTKKEYRNDNSIEIEMNDWLKFLGIFLTDGSLTFDEKRGIYKVSIFQKKEKFINQIEEVLEKLPFNFQYKESKFEYYTCSKQLSNFLLETKSKNLRTIPNYVFNCSLEQKNILLKWLFYGDGSFNKNGDLWKITVCSKTMTDQIGRLLIETGRMYSLYEYSPKEKVYNGKLMKSNYPLTTIQIISKENTHIKKNHIIEIDYDDKVYCVSVPNRTLLVEKSGQLVWCGNSWMSASQPYLYNPKECVILAYKNSPKKLIKGQAQWTGIPVVQENGKTKMTYLDEDKKEFMELVYGQWSYFADTKTLTKATFSMDIPTKAIKILTYKNDIVLDPFCGSATTMVAAEVLDRRWIGIELSPNYTKIGTDRVQSFVDKKKQMKFEFEEGAE
jgi:DNA modification methylase